MFSSSVPRYARLYGAFSRLLTAVPRNPRFLKFLAGGETTSNRFIRTLLMEEGGHAVCRRSVRTLKAGRSRCCRTSELQIEGNGENQHRV